MKYLEAQKQAGKEAKKSILPDNENKMQSGNRPGQRGNNLNRNDPQSLISGTNQQNELAGGTSNEKGAVAALAKELGVDLSTVKGTGHRGAVTEKDVRDAQQK